MAKVRVRKETGTLYLDFFHQGVRCREQTALEDTPANRRKVAKVLEKIEAEIKLGIFDYARYFPTSKHASRFTGPAVDVSSAPAPEPIRSLIAASVQERFGTHSPAPVSAVSVPVAVAVPFKAFTETWVRENEVQWRRSYHLTVTGIIDCHLLPKFGETPVSEVTREAILQFRAELAKLKGRKRATLSPRRVNAVMNILSLILTEASDRYKFISPYYNIKPLKLPKVDVEPFTMEEVRRITDTVREDYRDYFLIRFFTGMRTGEIDGLKWQYVDFEHRLILIRETIVGGVEDEETKTRESHRDIQMSELVYQAFLRQKAWTGSGGKYVFCNRAGQPLDHNNVTKRVWYPLLRHLGLKARRPYQTRHTAATLWLASGENPEWIARQMGHATTEMLFRIYSRFVPNLTRRDGSAFESLVARHFALGDTSGAKDARDG